MQISRRGFLRLLAGATAALGLPSLGERFLTHLGRTPGPRTPAGHSPTSTVQAVGALHNRTAAASTTSAAAPASAATKKRRWVMVIDLARCDGCGRCTTACTEGHFVPKGQEWIKVYSMFDSAGGPYWLPRPCMQCDNP
ncbi:MAG: twin-arginine translocation signal domain-containing protein, partial [Armatimonadetes bacterium]|nr:twin-arginine translocation signal domain-containing protein [Armatimonadota bacterium]